MRSTTSCETPRRDRQGDAPVDLGARTVHNACSRDPRCRPARSTTDGVVLLYNGANHPRTGDPLFPPFAYQPGQVLLDRSDPSACIARGMHPFLAFDANGASAGQVENVCFAQALV